MLTLQLTPSLSIQLKNGQEYSDMGQSNQRNTQLFITQLLTSALKAKQDLL